MNKLQNFFGKLKMACLIKNCAKNMGLVLAHFWKELHDNVVRNQLEKMESTAAIVYLGIIIASLLLTIFSHKAAGMLFTLLMPGHCIYYVVRYRKVSGKFISSDNVFLSRSGRGANNVFYRLSWVFVFIILSSIVYAILT